MNIPAYSVASAQANIKMDVGVAMLSKSIDTVEKHSDGIIKLMERSAMPNVGTNLDIMA